MLEQIKKLKTEIAQFSVQSQEELAAFRQKFIAKKGAIAGLFANLKDMAPEEKKIAGKLLNELKNIAEERFSRLANELSTLLSSHWESEIEDLTLPPPTAALGTLHPLTLIKDKIIALLMSVGFEMAEGPEIEDDWHNFEALKFPPNHPARDMLDTFFIAKDPSVLLRTHTSSVQIRIAKEKRPPIRTMTVGRVYRHETISARAHCIFHQVEGFYINEEVSFVELKQTLLYLIRGLFGQNIKMRLRPSYFPFTVLSAEVDIDCQVCGGQGCQICKYTGWVEIMGAGMIDPDVLQNCYIDPAMYTGFALGMGIERIAMLLYHINDLRLFTENDIGFLKQFTGYA